MNNKYFLDQFPIEQILKSALKHGGDFADIFFESTNSTTVTADNNRIEKIVSGINQGIGIRVVFDTKTAYGFTNDCSIESLLELSNSVAAAVKGNTWESDINLSKLSPKQSNAIEIYPSGVAISEKTDMVKDASNFAWKFDKRIQQASILYKDSTRNFEVVSSFGNFVKDEKIDSVFLASIIATDGKIIQTGYEPVGGFFGFEYFKKNSPLDIVKLACDRSIMMLSSRPAPSGTMPVVLSSDAGGTMVHEAVGHGLEADLAVNGFSVYQNQIGKKVASELVTVIDDGTLEGQRGTYSFDDEGTPAQKTVLIENGILKSYMHNIISSRQSGLKSTGNGRRESYKFRPVVRMTNTIIASGTDDPEAILNETPKGLFVKKMGGGQVNTITGDFVFDVQEGYLIENGKLGSPVRGATLTGNGPDVLKQIDKVGTDLGFGIGTCGKDRQGVPVSDAQPTLRIPEMVVGGTS